MANGQYGIDHNEVCFEIEKAKLSSRGLWFKQYKYCLEDCNKCGELQILKKILWEIRKRK